MQKFEARACKSQVIHYTRNLLPFSSLYIMEPVTSVKQYDCKVKGCSQTFYGLIELKKHCIS
jgi:hypothetical protein